MEEVGSFRIEWVDEEEEDDENNDLITEEVYAGDSDNDEEEAEEEEYLVGEEIIPTSEINAIPNSLDQSAAENLIYMAQDGNVAMGDLIEEQVEQAENGDYNEQQYFECQVTEEVITDDWVQQQGEERVEILIDNICTTNEAQIEEEVDVPLPTDQDEYTTSRPYPCDFCSRRFRKKANLMNHMVAHQNDRPHVCNLCGARYIRRCDLLNHLKIHAYAPEQEEADEAEFLEDEIDHKGKRPNLYLGTSADGLASTRKPRTAKTVPISRVKHKTIKQEIQQNEEPKFDYIDEDMKLLCEAAQQHETYNQIYRPVERYPVVDPKKPFVCQHCGVGFAREKALASHSRVHGGDSPFECETCGEMFWDASLLRDHQLSHHPDQASNSEYEPGNEDDSESDMEAGKYGDFYCDICGMSFHRHNLLKRHAKMHVKKEIADGDSERHSCNVCGDTFAEALDLLAHAEVHTRFQPFKCLLCGETFLEELTIKLHLNTVHEGELTPNSCRLCGKACRDGRALMKHAWDHSREKNHSCSKCAKTFHNKTRLKRHMVSHRNKSVSCDVCGEEFPDGRSLMNHRHSHTNISGRQFPCRECGKTFGSRSSQQIHIRIHTGERPYGCKYCWKAFADGGTLRKHERIHTGEKPYACSVCPRAFNQRVVLREHIRSHHSAPDSKRGTSVTPYYCTVCSDLFLTGADLVKHLIEHSDMNTAMKRQPPTGPRKYKRRRKLKPHELERLRAERSKTSDLDSDDDMVQSADDLGYFQDEIKSSPPPRPVTSKTSRSSAAASAAGGRPGRRGMSSSSSSAKKTSADKYSNYDDKSHTVYEHINNSVPKVESVESMGSGSNRPSPKPPARKRLTKQQQALLTAQQSRPKMIHTQKTRVAVEDGKRKTKTLITRTAPTTDIVQDRISKPDGILSPSPSMSSSASSRYVDRNRPRTKNVNYHVFVPDKLPNATFPEVDPLTIKQERLEPKDLVDNSSNNLEISDVFTIELTKKNFDKYNSDIVNDLEEILRSPIKRPTRSSKINYEKDKSENDDSLKMSPQSIADGLLENSSSSRPRRSVANRNRVDYLQKASSSSSSVPISSTPVAVSKKSKGRQSVNRKRGTGGTGISPPTSAKRNRSSNNNNLMVDNINDDADDDNDVDPDDTNYKSNVFIKQETEETISDKNGTEIFKCEMCSEVFYDRTHLLYHVPIHI